MTRIILIFFLGLVLTINCIAQTNTQNSSAFALKKTYEKMQGIWFHDQDSLATVRINDYVWILNYKDEQTTTDDSYTVKLTDKLSENELSWNLEYLILTNKTDTLKYEIIGVTDTTFSVMYIPSGKFHLYRRQK